MFDFSQIIELAKIEPGHGLLQSVLLFMIWLQSRGLRKEIVILGDSINDMKNRHEERFKGIEGKVTNHEGRILVLEKKGY